MYFVVEGGPCFGGLYEGCVQKCLVDVGFYIVFGKGNLLVDDFLEVL